MVCVYYTNAQSLRKQLIKADFTLYKENFAEAIWLYDQILAKAPTNEQATYHKLIAEQLTTHRGTDLSELLAFEDSRGHTDKFYNYWLGRVHFLRYEFHLAEKHFEAFLDLDAYKSKEIIAETEGYLAKIQVASSFYDHPTKFEIESLGYPINSTHNDLSPGFYKEQNELVFASSRPSRNIPKSDTEFLIFHSKRTADGWIEPQAIPSIEKLPESAARVEVTAAKGKLFIFNENSGGDILVLNAHEGGWSQPAQFDAKIRSNQVASDFFLNEEENHLLFAAGRGGKGLDIFESRKGADGLWSDPTPIPGVVNTEFDEDSPFLAADGQSLYFSGNGPNSMGGFDVFRSDWNAQTQSWSTPENLGFPVNTIDDEINYQLNPDNISGFLSSNRLHSLGGFDIYYFHKAGSTVATGFVRDLSGNPLENVEVFFHPLKYTDETFRTVSGPDGAYRLEVFAEEEFAVELAWEEEVFHNDLASTKLEGRNKLLKKDFNVQKPSESTNYQALYVGDDEGQSEEIELLGSRFRIGEKAVLTNIYFDAGSSEIQISQSETLMQIQELLENYPQIRIEIGGHTDDSESLDPVQLSFTRAKEVVELLQLNHIPTERVTYQGYGDSQPLASNDDEIEGREFNRRIEVRVVE